MKPRGAKYIEERIYKFSKEGKTALIPYITAFDPDGESTLEILKYLADTEPACIELGFPFSDPVADGPTIQKAILRALNNKPSFDSYLEIVSKFKEVFPEIPIICMTYYNVLYRRGLENVVKLSLESGLDGFIIPDLPLEESDPWQRVNKGRELATIFLAAPTTSDKRLKKIAKASKGFLYYVSLTGITGARDTLPRDLTMRLQQIRNYLRIPLGVGFGISKKEHVKSLKPFADALIIGSALVQVIEREGRSAGPHLRSFLNSLKDESP